MRPSSGHARAAPAASGAPLAAAAGGRSRPQSAAVDGSASLTKDKASASSDELIRDLESKVRRVVEQKRGESDRLRFAVARKRDEVARAKLVLQDLLKDSGALGIHYDLREHVGGDAAGKKDNQDEDGDEETRLQPIASISRRPVYSKHTNIHELEAKLDRRAKEAHLVHRRTLVLDHIKKRLLNERVEVAQTTNQLKQVYADLTHETHELQKKDIAAAEAVSQAQTRLVQQRADMAASVRKFRRELAVRHKWAREKAKFEAYYNNQLQAAMAKASAAGTGFQAGEPHAHEMQQGTASAPAASQPKRSPTSILKMRRSSSHLALEEKALEDAEEKRYREAFQRIGVDPRVEAIDPEEIIRICLSHEELRKELDAKHDEAVERIAQLREQISKARSLAREDVPLSKRGTSQKIETKQLEISNVERQLATVVDQYMFVENTVRPIKIGLQQVLQNVSSATVNVDNMAALEECLVESCEEMMRMLRANSPPPVAEESNPDSGSNAPASIPEDEAVEHDVDESEATSSLHHRTPGTEPSPAREPEKDAEPMVSLESFTSPFNVRIAAKKRENYFIPGLTKPSATNPDDEESEENDFEVMDRAMVKRISSVVVCTSAGKKPKEASSCDEPSGSTHHSRHHTH